jgi:peptide/nickel transport system ATP-binding protein
MRAAIDLLAQVQIRDPQHVAQAYPHELSGGMGQRVMIAMMLAPDPELLIADEPTSALDATVQAEILRLIEDLVSRRGMGLILISHDLPLVSHFCDRVAVMYAGRVVEVGPVVEVIKHPAHPYTEGLMGSIPSLEHRVERLRQIDGSMPRLNAIPPGCAFNPRCPKVFDRCHGERPELLDAGVTRAACWLHADRAATPAERAAHA